MLLLLALRAVTKTIQNYAKDDIYASVTIAGLFQVFY